MEHRSVQLIDIGVNLTHKSFQQDVHAIIERASDAGVVQMIVTGTDLNESTAAQVLASKYPGVLYSTAGVHPHDAKHWTDQAANRLAELAQTPEVVAIGETGLDYYRDYSPRRDQEHAFQAQLELAADLGIAVFLHERGARTRFFPILERYRERLRQVVLHCFTGGTYELAACRDLDLHVGITGWICDERRGQHLLDLVPTIPEDRLMLETDAPYLLPRNIRPRAKQRRNEPAFLTYVLEAVAEALDRDREAVADVTTRTARKFFGLDPVAN